MLRPITGLLVLGVALGDLIAQPASRTRGATQVPDTLATLSAGGASTCLTTTAGAAWCWGAFDQQNGAAARVIGVDGQPARLRSLATSDYTRCGLTFDGAVWCDRGVTGGWIDSAGRSEPIPAGCRFERCIGPLPIRGALPNARLRAVVAGFMHACTLAPNGAAYCWGTNNMGYLGNGTWAADSDGSTGEISRAPTLVVGGLRFSQLSTTAEVTCGLAAPDRDVYCWGYGQNGETGDSSIMTYCGGEKPYYNKPCSAATPRRVFPESLPGDYRSPNEVKFATVAAGFRMACAVSDRAEAYCWGSNYRCELGRCRSGESARTHRIGIPGRVAEIAVGYWHACARTEDRRIFCWGNNTAGQLGSLTTVNAGPDGGPPDYRDSTNERTRGAAYGDPCFNGGRCSPVPVEVSSPHRWAALTLGTEHACALAEDDGGIYCWGGSDSLALGAGARLVRCENRSAQWPDRRCQPIPVRVPGLPPLAAPRRAEARSAPERATSSGGAGAPNVDRTARVSVSRRELRVVFPRDTAGLWGWSERTDPNYSPYYVWTVLVNGMDGPRTFSLQVGRTGTAARELTSLDSLVASGRPTLCTGGWGGACNAANASASVDRGQVVLTLRDSASIARLFGLRPAAVRVWQHRPDEPYQYMGDSTRVEYVAPQIPEPNAATRADAARSQRAYESSISSISRSISSSRQSYGALWIATGDSASLTIAEMSCHYDACGGRQFGSPAAWTVGDSTVIRVRVADRGGAPTALERARSIVVTGRRVGRTTVRADLPPSASDTMPSREPPLRTLIRDVVVTVPAERVELTPPSDTIRVGTAVEFRARALDRSGRTINGAPIQVQFVSQHVVTAAGADGRVPFTFSSSGTQTIIASFGGKADTLTVAVAPSR